MMRALQPKKPEKSPLCEKMWKVQKQHHKPIRVAWKCRWSSEWGSSNTHIISFKPLFTILPPSPITTLMKGLQDQKGNGPRSIVIRRWWKKVVSCYLLYNADLKSEDQVKSKRLFWNRCSKPRLAGLYWTTQKPLTTFGHLNSLQAHTTNQKSQPLKSLTRNEASTKEESWSNSIIISHHQINALVPNSGKLDSTWNRNWVNLYILVHSWSYPQLPAIQEADLLPSCPDLLKLHHAN